MMASRFMRSPSVGILPGYSILPRIVLCSREREGSTITSHTLYSPAHFVATSISGGVNVCKVFCCPSFLHHIDGAALRVRAAGGDRYRGAGCRAAGNIR